MITALKKWILLLFILFLQTWNVAVADEKTEILFSCHDTDLEISDSGYAVTIESKTTKNFFSGNIVTYTATLFESSFFGLRELKVFPIEQKITSSQTIFYGEGFNLSLSVEPTEVSFSEYSSSLSANRPMGDSIFALLICRKDG